MYELIAPVVDHSASTNPIAVATTLDAGCASRFLRELPSSSVACLGITVPKCAIRFWIVSGPATSVKSPTVTRSTDGIAKKLLYASAEASIIALWFRNSLPARTKIAFQSASERSRRLGISNATSCTSNRMRVDGMTPAVETHTHVIVGAGSAGLATGALLRRAGFEPLILEAGPEPGAAWRERYDRLRLHTPRRLSGLPGHRIPRRFGRWVTKDDLLEYLLYYADAEGLDIRMDTRVERIERDGIDGDGIDEDGDAWRLDTAAGPLRAANVIVATGYNGAPFVPEWPGLDGFTGELLHSSEYRNPKPFHDRDVLVVGVGNSGAEIATDVAEGGAARARLSVRTPPQILRRATAGIPAQWIGIAIRKLPPFWVDPISKAQRRISIPDLAAQGLPRP